MKKSVFFPSVITLIFIAGLLYALKDEESELPPGMEVIKVGSAKILVPKGTKVYKRGSLITLETINEYTARKLVELDERLKEIETRQNQLEEEIKKIKGSGAEIPTVIDNQNQDIPQKQQNQ